MTTSRNLSTTLAIAALLGAACSDGRKEESPGEVLARDSSLASDLRQADTSAYAEAADVAMAFDPDSATAPPVARPAKAAPGAAPVQLKPKPATIHPERLARPTISPRPERSSSGTSASSPNAVAILSGVPGASLPPVDSDEPCSSPAPADQRRCLMMRLSQSDVALDRSYQALIAGMKQEAGTRAGDREPESVQQLRAAQRAWLVYRDTECRRRNRGQEGALWAPVRAQCLGEFSTARADELGRALRQRRSSSGQTR
jgi:uncharacterized protein YecT (DUF1311 family)